MHLYSKILSNAFQLLLYFQWIFIVKLFSFYFYSNIISNVFLYIYFNRKIVFCVFL